MKVALLSSVPPPAGGIAVWTVRMLNATLKNDWETVLVDEKFVGKREAFGSGTKRNYFNELIRCFRIWRDLKRTLKDDDVKVVHCCIPATTFAMMREYVCAKITHRRHRKFIIHFRCTVPNLVQSRIGKHILKRFCKNSDLIMSLNQKTTDYLKTLCNTPIVIIPNFVSKDELIDNRILNEDIKKVLYVGGVVENKGAMDMIDVAASNPSIVFDFAGKVDPKVSEYYATKNINNVNFLGVLSHDDIKSAMLDADVFLFLSYYEGEGFSNALAEAMATGLPCIVSDWAANSDMIENSGGFVVPIKSPKDAIDALSKMKPVEIREKQSRFNIAKVKNNYIEDIVIDQYVDTYEALLQNKL